MSALETQLTEDRALRDSARAVFDARMAEVRRALGERSIPQRAADEAKSRALAVAEEGADIAQESKWVLAATGLAILAWLLRRPIINSAQRVYARLFKAEPALPWERWRDWIKSKVTP
jgi:hypothetical protein